MDERFVPPDIGLEAQVDSRLEPLHATAEDLDNWRQQAEKRLGDVRHELEDYDIRRQHALERLPELEAEQDVVTQGHKNTLDSLATEEQRLRGVLYDIEDGYIHANEDEVTTYQQRLAGIENQKAGLRSKIDRQSEALTNHPELEVLKPSYHVALENEQQRRQQQIEATERNQILEFTDETDLSRYGRYLQFAEQPALGADFLLPQMTSPDVSPDTAAAALSALPFIGEHEVTQHYPLQQTQVVLQGKIPFPTERIVGVESFDSWAGRGINGSDQKAPSRTTEGQGSSTQQTSIETVTRYAQDQLPVDSVRLDIFRDAAGEYWALSTGDGSHRLAAAKLRGLPTITATEVRICSEEDMPTVPFSVRERVAGHFQPTAS